MRAIALLYHDVVPENRPEASGFLTPGANRYKLTETQFRRHLEAVSRAGKSSPRSVLELREGGVPLLITFDDGGVSAYGPVSEMLSQFGWTGHFLVTTDYIGKAGFLSVDQIRALRREGHVIGSHSCSHPARMSACSPEQLRSEWKRSTTVLSDILNEPVTVASIPAGYYSDEVARAADEAGIRALFSSEPQTRTWRVGECSVLGRYCAVADTPPEWAARIVRGDLATRGLAYAGWNAKKLIKKTTAGLWLRFRATVLEGQ